MPDVAAHPVADTPARVSFLARFGPFSKLAISGFLTLCAVSTPMIAGFGMACERMSRLTPTTGMTRINTSSGDIWPVACVMLVLLVVALIVLWRSRWLKREPPADARPLRSLIYRAAVASCSVGLLIFVANIWSHGLNVIPGDRRFIAAMLSIFLSQSFFTIWVPVLMRAEQITFSRAGHPRINCPACGYSLRGLSELTCPECGRRWTVDQLFAGHATTPPP